MNATSIVVNEGLTKVYVTLEGLRLQLLRTKGTRDKS